MTDGGPDVPDATGGGEPVRGRHAIAPRRGRALSIAGWGALGVVVIGVVWIVVTGLIARAELNDARSRLASLRSAIVSGDDARAQRLVADIADSAGTAHWATSGPAWWVASNVPGLGSPLRTARVIAAQSDRLGDVLPGVVRLRQTVSAVTHGSLTSLDLSAVSRALPELHRAATTASSAYDTVRAADGSWLSPVSSARDAFATALERLDGELGGADRAARIAIPMLGRDGPQRYFIGFLNEAEARGGGGIPGAYAIASADHGRISFEHFGSDNDLARVRAKVDLGAEFDARYAGNDPKGTIQNSNLSPDFSYAARIWAGMWQARTGQRIDGAIAIDPTALSYLLRVTGPARLPGGGTVSAENVVALTQQQQYVRYPGTSKAVTDARKAYLTGLATAISSHLTIDANPTELIKAVSHAAAERRFVVWSRVASIERELRDAQWAGSLGNDTAAPYAGFVVNNATGSKLDYYLDRRMTYRRSNCSAGGRASATITLTNTAPTAGLPQYVTYRADTPPPGARPGDSRVLLSYYADRSARITGLRVDGKPVPLVLRTEGNTVTVTTTVELRAGASVTAEVTVAEPRADGPVEVLHQPLATPLSLDLRGDRCR